MSKLRSGSLLSLAAMVIVLFSLLACGEQTTPAGDTPTATAAGETSTAAQPTAAAADTPAATSPTPTPVGEAQGTSRVSIDEYLALCGLPKTEVAETEEIPLKEISDAFRDYTERLESVEPPLEVADWHHAVLPYQKAFRESVDEYLEDPGDQSQDDFLLSTAFSLASRYQPTIDEAILDMDSDVQASMAMAGCIDEDTTEAIQMQEAREEIPVGGSVSGTLEEPNRTVNLQFQAEEGQKYLIEVTWEGVPEVFLLIKDPPDPVVTAFNMYDSDSSPLLRRWTAWESGTFHVDVQALEGAGSFNISIAIDTSPDNPADVSAIWEGSAIRVSWEPAEGAEYYILYHDDRGPGCKLRDDGTPAFCDELASDVAGTSYTHAAPDPDGNFYFVVACNADGCSEIDSNNPASP